MVTAKNQGVTLVYPLSNTTHESQPKDKAVFKNYETLCDKAVLNILHILESIWWKWVLEIINQTLIENHQ